MSKMNDNYIIDLYINKAEDEHTVMAKKLHEREAHHN